jgi:hypothetical protein
MPTPTPSIESPASTAIRTGPLRLSRPAVRVFAKRPEAEPGRLETRFMTDLLATFGVAFDPDLYAQGGGNSFSHMGQELLDSLDRPLPALDAAVLAYHLPDMNVIEVAGCYLAGRCPGNPPVFSVSGQGVGAPFTALRILNCMRQADRLADGAVFVLDHSTVPYRDADTHDGAVRDCGVLLYTDTAGTGDEVVLDFLEDQPVADPADSLTALVERFPQARIVAGHMLADRVDPEFRARHGIVEGPRHHLCTSAWAALALHWSPDLYTVVADYDPHTGRLFQAGLRPGAQP